MSLEIHAPAPIQGVDIESCNGRRSPAATELSPSFISRTGWFKTRSHLKTR